MAKGSSKEKNDFSAKPKHDPIRILNKSTFILVLISLIFIIYNSLKVFSIRSENSSFIPSEERDEGEGLTFEKIVIPEPLSFNEYTQSIAFKDIFKSVYVRDQKVEEDQQSKSAPAVDLIKDYRLVGILLSQKPQVVIEDLKNKETLFLNKGDRISGAVLDKVEEGKVIFIYNNQSIEMNQ